MVQGKVVQTHGHRCFSPDPCTEEGRGNGNDLQPLDLFWLVGMKTTCTASDLGKSVQASIIYKSCPEVNCLESINGRSSSSFRQLPGIGLFHCHKAKG